MKYVPLSKQSTETQKAHYSKQRGSWNGVLPVTRSIPNKKAYIRSRAKQSDKNLSTAEY